MSKKNPPSAQCLAEELGLTTAPYCCGVDSHAHLDSKQFDEDREEILARAKACGIAHIGNIFLKPQEFTQRAAFFAKHPQVFFVLGIHPCEAMQGTEENFSLMESLFTQEKRLKALGEIGLDFYWDDCPKDVQMHAFVQQLHLAKKLSVPVVIHSRDATDATIAILEKEDFAQYPVLWHCFGGNCRDAKRIMHNGWHISIPGPVSYPKNSDLRDALGCIALDKIMLETDAPYLSPQQWRGKRNEPAHTVATVEAMAQALAMEAKELWKICGENAQRFFNLNETST